jgi:hypothetical protein
MHPSTPILAKGVAAQPILPQTDQGDGSILASHPLGQNGGWPAATMVSHPLVFSIFFFNFLILLFFN